MEDLIKWMSVKLEKRIPQEGRHEIVLPPSLVAN
jgi:hypothetical protein